MGGPPATRGVALAAAPCNAPHGSRFVRLRSRRPRPPNGCARWLPEVAIAPPWSPGGASRAGSPSAVVRRSPGLSRRSPARARVAPGKWLAPCGQDMDSVARNHLAACGGGEPLRSRSRQKGPGRLLRPGPNAQSPRPFWFSSALRSSSQNALIAVAIPRSVKRTTRPVEWSTAKPSLPPFTFHTAPRAFEKNRY